MRELVGIKVSLEYLKQQHLKLTIDEEIMKSTQIRKRESKMYRYALSLTLNPWFNWFISLSIISNTIILSLDTYPENYQRTYIVEKLNIMFTIIFSFEMVVKLFAYGFKNFFKGSWLNIFDVVIVVASIIDIFISNFFLL